MSDVPNVSIKDLVEYCRKQDTCEVCKLGGKDGFSVCLLNDGMPEDWNVKRVTDVVKGQGGSDG